MNSVQDCPDTFDDIKLAECMGLMCLALNRKKFIGVLIQQSKTL